MDRQGIVVSVLIIHRKNQDLFYVKMQRAHCFRHFLYHASRVLYFVSLKFFELSFLHSRSINGTSKFHAIIFSIELKKDSCNFIQRVQFDIPESPQDFCTCVEWIHRSIFQNRIEIYENSATIKN